MIQTDDQDLASLGRATMPEVTSLARRGTTFTEAVATTSPCPGTSSEADRPCE